MVAALAIAIGLGNVVSPGGAWWDTALYNVPVTAGMALAAAGARANWHRRRAPWVLAAFAVCLFGAGEFVWWGYAAAGRDPFPSWADACFLSGYVVLGLAALSMLPGSVERDGSAWIDAGVLALIAGLGTWAAILQPASESDASLVEHAFTVAYPLGDVLILALLLRMVLRGGARKPAAVVFAVGVLALLVADTTFSWLDVRGLATDGSLTDVMWIVAYVTVGLSGLLPGAGDSPPPEPDGYGLARGRLALVLGAVLVPFTVLVTVLARADHLGANTLTASVVVAACVVALVAVRLWGLLGHARRVALRQGEQRLAALVHHSADAIMLVTPGGVVSFASPAAGALWGVAADRVTGMPLRDLVAPGARADVDAALDASAGRVRDDPVSIRTWVTRRAGARRDVEGTLLNLTDDPAVEAHVLTLRDVTERRALETRLEHRAYHDDLTGLANRALFLERVGSSIAPDGAARRVAVVFIDLDDFKAVNDGMGHAAGDRLLVEVARRLSAGARDEDTVARLGGDEFALLLDGVDDEGGARRLTEDLLAGVRRPAYVMGVALDVPASAGVALATSGTSVDDLLRDADIAMYEAKSAGKNRVAVFDDRLLGAASRRLELKVALPEALAREQFTLAYQPIRDAAGGRVHGVEALIRWSHPRMGQVSPAEIIPNAEESGLIVDIGRWVLDRACRQAAEWNAVASPLTMNVNVSGLQLRDAGFVGDVIGALEASGLAPPLLSLEITESVMVESLSLVGVIQRLRDLGVGIAIDDFGTGYSALAYLHRLPVSCVKLDRAFVSSDDDALLRGVLALARDLGLATVVEGVETAEQLEAVARAHGALVQGYYIQRPGSAEEIGPVLLGSAGRPAA